MRSAQVILRIHLSSGDSGNCFPMFVPDNDSSPINERTSRRTLVEATSAWFTLVICVFRKQTKAHFMSCTSPALPCLSSGRPPPSSPSSHTPPSSLPILPNTLPDLVLPAHTISVPPWRFWLAVLPFLLPVLPAKIATWISEAVRRSKKLTDCLTGSQGHGWR